MSLGTVTVTPSFVESLRKATDRVSAIEVAWTSDSSGNATVDFDLNGTILAAEFVPGTTGSQPTDQYHVVINDPYGVDSLCGLGANLSNSTKTKKTPILTGTDGTNTTYFPNCVAGTHSLSVSGAGDTKSGKVVLYMR
jgi:hypothetical protein